MLVAMNNTVFVGSFVVYTLAVVAVGLYSSRYAKRSDEDFFLAGRSLGKWVGALSASASSESGWVTLGLVGMGFMQGVQAYWMVPGCLLGYAFIWFVLANRMRHRSGELNALTIPDFFSQHFKERVPILRVLSVLVIIVAMLLRPGGYAPVASGLKVETNSWAATVVSAAKPSMRLRMTE